MIPEPEWSLAICAKGGDLTSNSGQLFITHETHFSEYVRS